MFVRSATGTEAPGSGQPLPAPARWHLRTQVSRKTLFDLIHDTLPPGGLAGVGLPEEGAPLGAGEAVGAAHWPSSTGNGVLPQAYLDPNAATVPMSLNPAALWNDGDTSPDMPEHWRPITITLASTALTPQAQLPPPRSPSVTQHPLQAVARRAGWMLSGVALTFVVSAAAFGGGPMIRAIRSVVARPQPASIMAAPAKPSPDQVASPIGEPPSHVVLAAVDPAEVKTHPIAADAPAAGISDSDAGASNAPNAKSAAVVGGDRRGAGLPARVARRPRAERRASRAPTAPTTDSLLAEDAVMPLESAPPVARPAPVRPVSTTIATTTTRMFRPIDGEDPFGGR